MINFLYIIGALSLYVGVWNACMIVKERRQAREHAAWKRGFKQGYAHGRDLGEMLGAARGYRLRCILHHMHTLRGHAPPTSEEIP